MSKPAYGERPLPDDSPGLFDMTPDPAVLEAARARAEERGRLAGLSAGQRLTLRQKADVANGRHPLMGGPTRPELGTCGDCVHRVLIGSHSRGWPKCDWGGPSQRGLDLMSHSAATDCRAWWPACSNFEPKPKEATDGP
jgi:hypothetical protein